MWTCAYSLFIIAFRVDDERRNARSQQTGRDQKPFAIVSSRQNDVLECRRKKQEFIKGQGNITALFC